MNCKEASERLAAAVLGDLDRDEQRAVHAHLAGCDRCLEEEHELFRSMHLLRAHAGEEPEVDIHDAVLARVAETTPPRRRVGLLTQTLLTAAASALVVVGLQTALQAWNASPVLPVSPASRPGGATTTLLQGTLFDRQRHVPDELRSLREQLRRGDARLPIEL